MAEFLALGAKVRMVDGVVGDPEAAALLAARVDEDFERIPPEELADLQMELARGDADAGDGSSAAAQAVHVAVQVSLNNRMNHAKDCVVDLLNNNDKGDINMGIRKLLRNYGNPLPLLMVLQVNIQEAQARAEEDKMRALTHIHTIIQEELEKKVSRVRGLINKLMRLDDPGIRDRLLRHHLTPVEVSAPADPFGEGEGGGEAKAPLLAAMVPPERLGAEFTRLLEEVDRTLRTTLPEDYDARFDTLDRIRLIAKEARLVIGDVYGKDQMDEFSSTLIPSFNPLMEWKYNQQQEAKQKAEAAAAEAEAAGAAEEAPAAAAA